MEPGRYHAEATDGSGETIVIRIVGSSKPAGTLDNPRARIPGLSTAYTDDGRLMTPAKGENTFKLVAHGPQRAYKITGPA
ncbi:MAG: hypothetical protein JNM59_09340 [Hyphomonadaceae bacterium]|nr:hypothetical protein [Hyphomonadaceae bacterium]